MAGVGPSGRLTAISRIRRQADFARSRSAGKQVRTLHFVLVLCVRPTDDGSKGPRLGVITPRRIGNAVRRNRAKRLVREAFRSNRELFLQELDVVVIVTRSLDSMKLADVADEWRRETARIGRRTRDALAAVTEAKEPARRTAGA